MKLEFGSIFFSTLTTAGSRLPSDLSLDLTSSPADLRHLLLCFFGRDLDEL